MKSFLASVLAIFFHTLGIAIGAVMWVSIGYGLGSLFGTPMTGALSGLAIHTAAYLTVIEQTWLMIERSQKKFLVALGKM